MMSTKAILRAMVLSLAALCLSLRLDKTAGRRRRRRRRDFQGQEPRDEEEPQNHSRNKAAQPHHRSRAPHSLECCGAR